MDEKENVQKNEKKGTSKLLIIGGGILLLIVLAAAIFIGINMLSGGGEDGKKLQ